jgi:hypothetical protein
VICASISCRTWVATAIRVHGSDWHCQEKPVNLRAEDKIPERTRLEYIQGLETSPGQLHHAHVWPSGWVVDGDAMQLSMEALGTSI